MSRIKLPHEFTLDRYGLHVRFVTEADAEFIVHLRTTGNLGRFIKPTSNDVEAQRKWIQNYKIQEAAGEGYYFIYEIDGVAYGVNRITKFVGNDCETGSWVFLPEAPFGAAIASEIILKEIIFDILECDNITFDVRNLNGSVQKYHRRYNPQIAKVTELDTYFILSKDNFTTHKHYYLRLLNI